MSWSLRAEKEVSGPPTFQDFTFSVDTYCRTLLACYIRRKQLQSGAAHHQDKQALVTTLSREAGVGEA